MSQHDHVKLSLAAERLVDQARRRAQAARSDTEQ